MCLQEWRTFRDTDTGTGMVEPTIVSFPAYSRKDLADILVMNWKVDSTDAAADARIEQDSEATAHAVGMLRAFVVMMLEVFYPVCRDLLELQRLLREMLPKVVAKQMHQLAEQSSGNGNGRHGHGNGAPLALVNGNGRLQLSHAVARPVLTEALRRQFYSVCAVGEGSGGAADSAAAAAAAAVPGGEERRTRSTMFELPLYTKYLLVAAYLASHVPPKNDKLYFTRAGMTKNRRRKPSASAAAELDRAHMQPSAFPLERLVAIFEALHPSSTTHGSTTYSTGEGDELDLRGARYSVA